MTLLRASRCEEDIVSSGVVESYGDIAKGLRAIRFEDRENGVYLGTGGLIGSGGVLVDQYSTTALTLLLDEQNFINYEKALDGAVALMRGDTCLETSGSKATVAQQSGFKMEFRPAGKMLRGVQVALMLDALDSFLERGGERRVGPLTFRVVEGSGVAGPDAALAALAEHVLNHFELYRSGIGSRRARLAEALITETFVQFLHDVGSLHLEDRVFDVTLAKVKRAEDFMHARFQDPITIPDVAAAVGVSLRGLQIGFREKRGTTPRLYLMSVRLERAHEMLLANGNVSVTSIAYNCGITHMGRFAQVYRSRFGEYPSETLRRRHRS